MGESKRGNQHVVYVQHDYGTSPNARKGTCHLMDTRDGREIHWMQIEIGPTVCKYCGGLYARLGLGARGRILFVG